jgi:hypothetical protein
MKNLTPFLFCVLASITLSLIAIPTTTTTVFAQSSDPNQLRIIWRTVDCSGTTSCNALRDATNTIVGDNDNPTHKDTLIFHFGSGVDPQPYHINAMKGVTNIIDFFKGFEFFSLAELQEHIQLAADNGFKMMSYDLEAVYSPQSEVDDPVGSFQAAWNMVVAFNAQTGKQMKLMAAPSRLITEAYGDQIAPYTHWYHIQSQALQDNDATCDVMNDYIVNQVAVLEAAKPALEDEISYQVSLTNHAAAGKTIYETAQDCIDVVTNTDVDGMSIWWGSDEYDSGQFQSLYKYYEDTYS